MCSVKMRGKRVNDTEQFTIIAGAMSESNGQRGNGQRGAMGNAFAAAFKAHLATRAGSMKSELEILLKLTAVINKINLFHYVNQTRFTDYKDDL